MTSPPLSTRVSTCSASAVVSDFFVPVVEISHFTHMALRSQYRRNRGFRSSHPCKRLGYNTWEYFYPCLWRANTLCQRSALAVTPPRYGPMLSYSLVRWSRQRSRSCRNFPIPGNHDTLQCSARFHHIPVEERFIKLHPYISPRLDEIRQTVILLPWCSGIRDFTRYQTGICSWEQQQARQNKRKFNE